MDTLDVVKMYIPNCEMSTMVGKLSVTWTVTVTYVKYGQLATLVNLGLR